ncbi:hypothetical protein GPECTOR_179g244 [Gonium pectorale]|uniref:MaoC-like domain-containing protein n=1 Tax=Gonium pectorale TaxID=33097 RepID=A0A150FX80_GONPE|nr:hypothetical protein GPECTOR_179g244 [Gonium pectorale]|eukprot:KXZ42221.1 hypothetical protein GPECTOR_179g244 [Gonium pectorale]
MVTSAGRGSGLVVVLRTVTTEEGSGREVAVNEFTTFVKGKLAANEPPPRAPDAVASFATSPDQAALYRLSGDYNPLHIDPRVSARVGFPQPILHGLCSLGVSVLLVLRAFAGDDPARLKSLKVRFSRHVLPGETLRVEMWEERPPPAEAGVEAEAAPNKIIFRTWVVERRELAIAGAAVELRPPAPGAQAAPAASAAPANGAGPAAGRPASRL